MGWSLYERLSAHIPEVLARHGVRPEDLRPLETFHPADTVLLTGSYARGEATASSDLDLTVICTSPPRRWPGTRGYPSVLGDSVVAARVNALVVNVDFMRRDMLRSVCATLDACADASESNIANLGPLELRALERTGTGVVFQLGSRDADLLAGIDLARACANTAAVAFLEGRSHLRAVDEGELDAASRALRLHRAAECLLCAEVNASGVLTYDIKYLAGRVRRLASVPYQELLDALTQTTDEARAGGPDDLRARVHAVAELFLTSLRRSDRRLVAALLHPVMSTIGHATIGPTRLIDPAKPTPATPEGCPGWEEPAR